MVIWFCTVVVGRKHLDVYKDLNKSGPRTPPAWGSNIVHYGKERPIASVIDRGDDSLEPFSRMSAAPPHNTIRQKAGRQILTTIFLCTVCLAHKTKHKIYHYRAYTNLQTYKMHHVFQMQETCKYSKVLVCCILQHNCQNRTSISSVRTYTNVRIKHMHLQTCQMQHACHIFAIHVTQVPDLLMHSITARPLISVGVRADCQCLSVSLPACLPAWVLGVLCLAFSIMFCTCHISKG